MQRIVYKKTKINSGFNSWEEIMFGISQGPTLGSLLFNIFLWDLFLIMDKIDIENYAEDNMPYTAGNSIEQVIKNLENASNAFCSCFVIMKSNPDNFHF